MKKLKSSAGYLVFACLALLLTACASSQSFNTEGVNLKLKPADAGSQMGQKVIWGGSIIDIRNLTDKTRLEVLAFPLSNNFQGIDSTLFLLSIKQVEKLLVGDSPIAQDVHLVDNVINVFQRELFAQNFNEIL